MAPTLSLEGRHTPREWWKICCTRDVCTVFGRSSRADHSILHKY